jgi:hypothetical protein
MVTHIRLGYGSCGWEQLQIERLIHFGLVMAWHNPLVLLLKNSVK